MQIVRQQFSINYDYPVVFVDGGFELSNRDLATILSSITGKGFKVLPLVEQAIVDAFPGFVAQLESYLDTIEQAERIPTLVEAGGEACKMSDCLVEQIYQASIEHGIDRHSVILAVGGGAWLDAVGYGASTCHRGIRLVRVPTTVLGQNDAGVGVKTAINYEGRKNFLGTFTPPAAVVNDIQFIQGLPLRERRAGIAEAIKVALIKDADFFAWLRQQQAPLAAGEKPATATMIRRCAELHLEHIRTSGDPFERGSARPLDFGHWSAHCLESLSHHRVRHGEAVAIGLLLDCLYCQALGWLDAAVVEDLTLLLKSLGFSLWEPELAQLDIASSLNEFREHLGGELSITLLKSVGSLVQVDWIDVPLMQACLLQLKQLGHNGNVVSLR